MEAEEIEQLVKYGKISEDNQEEVKETVDDAEITSENTNDLTSQAMPEEENRV